MKWHKKLMNEIIISNFLICEFFCTLFSSHWVLFFKYVFIVHPFGMHCGTLFVSICLSMDSSVCVLNGHTYRLLIDRTPMLYCFPNVIFVSISWNWTDFSHGLKIGSRVNHVTVNRITTTRTS